MTAVQEAEAPSGLGRILHRKPLSDMERESRILLSGHAVRARPVQMSGWSVITGLLAAAFIAGLYFGVLQVHWYIHILGWHQDLFYLKKGWDAGAWGLVHSGNWALYRHSAFRDQVEPALGTMAVMTLLARSKWWGVRVRTIRLVTAPFVLLAMTFSLSVLGVYLIDFGMPNAWHHFFDAIGHPGFRLHLGFLGKLSVETLIYGFLMGRVLHRYWAPVGATIQGYQIDRAVDRAKSRNNRQGRVPRWVRWPLSAPVIRERFGYMWRHDASIDTGSSVHKLLLTILGILVALVTLLGLAGHYYVGVLGHHIPYLAP